MDTQANTSQSADFVSFEHFKEFIEKEVLKLLQSLLKAGQITVERIREIARETLCILQPATTVDELYRCAVSLDDDHSELGPVVMKLMQEYEDKYNKKAVSQVSHLIKSGDYDGAQEMVKKVLMFKGA